MTQDQLDAMHAAIVARYPTGLTPLQYRRVVLESADEDGRDEVAWPVVLPADDWRAMIGRLYT